MKRTRRNCDIDVNFGGGQVNVVWEIKRNKSNSNSSSCSTTMATLSEQEIDLDIVVEHVLTCLSSLEANQPHHLPMTEEEFTLFLAQSKIYKLVVRVDVKVVFYHLLFNHVILIDSNHLIRKNPFFQPDSPLLGFVPIDSTKQQFSCDFTKALNNAIAWLQTTNDDGSVAFDPAQFYMALDPFCTFTREASLYAILGCLQKRQYIVTRYDGRLDYCLPKLDHLSGTLYEGEHVPLAGHLEEFERGVTTPII